MRKGLDKEYAAIRKEFLMLHPLCKVRMKGCGLRATQVHHKAGRIGDHYLNQDEFLPVCGNCHQWIEDHPLEALELGFSKLRLNKQ